MANNQPKVVILILNWNGWKDTIECLESVFRLDFIGYKVVVCDNGSTDGSPGMIAKWADGLLEAHDFSVSLKSVGVPVIKPLNYVSYGRKSAEEGGDKNENAALVLIQTGDNLGFAGGNNVGLRYCMARNDFDYVWILNNDTIVESDALTHLHARLVGRPTYGMCGSKLIFYHNPEYVQALGGSAFDASKGVVIPLGHLQNSRIINDEADIEAQMDYVVGASMLVSREFLNDIGLMTEDYFLYYEEIDWAFRARGKYQLAYSEDSHIYHKEGGSIGSSSTKEPSATSTHYLYRNRIRFNKRFNIKKILPCLYQILFEMLVLLKRKQFRTVAVAIRAVLSELIGSSFEAKANAIQRK